MRGSTHIVVHVHNPAGSSDPRPWQGHSISLDYVGLIPQSRATDPANVTNKNGVFHVKHAARFPHRISDQAVFFVNPRYVSITRGFCASSAAAPSNANSPVSST